MPRLKEFYFTAILSEISFPLGVKAIREPSNDHIIKKGMEGYF